MFEAGAIGGGTNGDASEFAELESNVRIYCRLFDRIFSHARGAVVFDQNGRRYIDFLCCAGALSYGHNDPHIKKAVLDYVQADGIVQSLDLHTTAKLAFLRTLRDVILRPRDLDYRVQCCGPSGSDAVEAALKLARKVTGRHTVAAFTNAYHGVTLGSLAATDNERLRTAAGIGLNSVVRIPFEAKLDPERNADGVALLEDMLIREEIDRPAAIIVETVQAEGGVNVASPDWIRRLSEFAARHAIVLVVDDVQVGCGRTGTFFSFERAGIKPDIVCLSKAIGGIGMPMAVTLIKPELDAWAPGDHVGTFRGNNLGFVAGAAALDYWRGQAFERRLEAHSRTVRTHLGRLLNKYPNSLTEVRGIGMIQGLVCAGPQVADAIQRAAFARGLIVELAGRSHDVIKLLPPLTIGESELEEGLSLLSSAAAAVLENAHAHVQ
jgi:diaminobutyrate-2-oxoglutarate transaminase